MDAFLFIRPPGCEAKAAAQWPPQLLASWRGSAARLWLQADGGVCCQLQQEPDWEQATAMAPELLGPLAASGHGGAGLAHTSFAASCAARLAKPDQLRVVAPGQAAVMLAALPLSWLPDLSSTAVRDLHALRVFTLGELAAVPPSLLSSVFGQQALQWQALVRGTDHPNWSSHAPHRGAPTVRYALNPASRTLTPTDIVPLFDELAAALALSERAAALLLVTVGFADGSQSERTERLRKPVLRAQSLQVATWPVVVKLLRTRRRRPEWIAVAATRTTEALVQLPLPLPLAPDERDWQLHATVNSLQARFGPQVISFGLPRRADELRTPA